MANIKDSTKQIFRYMQENNVPMTADEMAEVLCMDKRAIVGSVNSFIKKGWAVRTEREIELADGNHQRVKELSLTDLGLTVDIDNPPEPEK